MKRSVSYKRLPWLSAALGGIVAIARFGLYTLENSSGLLPHRHPLHSLSLAVAACALVLIGVSVRNLSGTDAYKPNFPFSRNRAQSSFLAGLVLLPVMSRILGSAAGSLELVWAVMGFAACGLFLATAYFQMKGEKPHFLLYFGICLFLVVHTVCCYRIWSGNPQVEDYIFSVFACVFLTLFAYHKTVFSAGAGKRRMTLYTGLMAMFFCAAALVGPDDGQFYAAGFLWATGNLCVIDPPEV